jgi:hypothetical protein
MDDVLSNKGYYDELHGALHPPVSTAGYGSDHELTGAHVPQPNPDPDFDLDHWMDLNDWTGLDDLPSSKPASPKELGQAHEYQMEHVQQPKPGPPNPELKDQPADIQAATYAAKGRAKESRRVSGTARENAAQRELQPAGRSLDSGE